MWHLTSEMTPESLLDRAGADGAPSAFGEFYSANSRRVLVFFTRRTFDVEVARDLTAETFAVAFEHRRRFRGATAAEAEAWLYGIARHQLARYARKGRVEGKAVARLGIQSPRVTAEDEERIVELAGLADVRALVADAFTDLPDGQREALLLRVIEERPYAQVADALGISEQTARARVSRALRRLGDTIEMTSATEVTP